MISNLNAKYIIEIGIIAHLPSFLKTGELLFCIGCIDRSP